MLSHNFGVRTIESSNVLQNATHTQPLNHGQCTHAPCTHDDALISFYIASISEALRATHHLYKMMLDLQKQMQTYEQEMLEMSNKLLGEVQKKMTSISSDIAKERKIDLLIERTEGGVVYFQSSFDITDELVKRYKAGK